MPVASFTYVFMYFEIYVYTIAFHAYLNSVSFFYFFVWRVSLFLSIVMSGHLLLLIRAYRWVFFVPSKFLFLLLFSLSFCFASFFFFIYSRLFFFASTCAARRRPSVFLYFYLCFCSVLGIAHVSLACVPVLACVGRRVGAPSSLFYELVDSCFLPFHYFNCLFMCFLLLIGLLFL